MSDFVKANQVFLDVDASTVDDALDFLSKQAVALGISDDEAAVLAGFKAREAEGTTGMMSGFAIPHCKAAAVKDAAVCVAKFASDVTWESMDGEPIKVAIALLVPDGEAGTTHLRLLSQVAVMLMDEHFRSAVLGTEDPAAIAELINDRLDD